MVHGKFHEFCSLPAAQGWQIVFDQRAKNKIRYNGFFTRANIRFHRKTTYILSVQCKIHLVRKLFYVQFFAKRRRSMTFINIRAQALHDCFLLIAFHTAVKSIFQDDEKSVWSMSVKTILRVDARDVHAH